MAKRRGRPKAPDDAALAHMERLIATEELQERPAAAASAHLTEEGKPTPAVVDRLRHKYARRRRRTPYELPARVVRWPPEPTDTEKLVALFEEAEQVAAIIEARIKEERPYREALENIGVPEPLLSEVVRRAMNAEPFQALIEPYLKKYRD